MKRIETEHLNESRPLLDEACREGAAPVFGKWGDTPEPHPVPLMCGILQWAH